VELRVAVVGARVAFFRSLLPPSLSPHKQNGGLLFLLLWLGGGKVGGAVTLVKGGGGGDGDRDFPDSAVSVLFRSCDCSGRVQDGVQHHHHHQMMMMMESLIEMMLTV